MGERGWRHIQINCVWLPLFLYISHFWWMDISNSSPVDLSLLLASWPFVSLNIMHVHETSLSCTSCQEPCGLLLWLCRGCFPMNYLFPCDCKPQPWVGWLTHQCLPRTAPVLGEKPSFWEAFHPHAIGHWSLVILLGTIVTLHLPLIWICTTIVFCLIILIIL